MDGYAAHPKREERGRRYQGSPSFQGDRDLLEESQQKGQPIHYLPTYRAEHQIKLFQWLGIVPGAEKPSVPFIMGVVNQRNYKSEEEIAEIEKACIVTADMHLTAM